MTYAEAQTEFSIRLYTWAQVAQEKEAEQQFPGFQLTKKWTILRCRFFQTLDQHSRTVFRLGLLQMRHQTAVKALREMISPEFEELMRREELFRSENNPWSQSSASAEGNKVATRATLRKAMASHFRKAFLKDCLRADPKDKVNSLCFRMVSRGWTIKTEVEFGRWDPEITCVHDIWTGKWITKDEPQVLFANCLGFQLNYGNELGIGSGWDNIALQRTRSGPSDYLRSINKWFVSASRFTKKSNCTRQP